MPTLTPTHTTHFTKGGKAGVEMVFDTFTITLNPNGTTTYRVDFGGDTVEAIVTPPRTVYPKHGTSFHVEQDVEFDNLFTFDGPFEAEAAAEAAEELVPASIAWVFASIKDIPTQHTTAGDWEDLGAVWL